MDFSGEMGFWQRQVAEVPEGQARRMAVVEALAVRSGQSALDIGCGGGHLVRELARAVGAEGRAVGLDLNAEQLTAARETCAGLAAAELQEGDVTALAFDDERFDAVCSIQTLEYVPDVGRALSEIRRVMKAGGKAAFVSVLWDHWRFHGPDPELNARMHELWRAHCPHQMLPLEMPRRLAEAGFAAVSARPLAFLNASLHENAYAFWVAKVTAAFAVAQGCPEADAARWLAQLSEAEREGRFGFVSVPVLTTATAI